MNLSTRYLGLGLRTPLIPSASPLTRKLENIRRMEDAGAAAIVLHSLFEEEIRLDSHLRNQVRGWEIPPYPGVMRYVGAGSSLTTPEEYLNLISAAKQAVSIPIIASLNGVTFGGWTTLSRSIASAGADGLELNFYKAPSHETMSGEDVEQEFLTILASVRGQIDIPVAVKLSASFTNLFSFAKRLDEHCVDALVLFNRFYQPDINPETMAVESSITLSSSADLRLPLRWTSLLYGRVMASLAASGGIHTARDVIKALMAGADVGMMCSALMANGIEYLQIVERELAQWLEMHGHDSVESIKGTMSHQRFSEPALYERAQYLRAITSRPDPGRVGVGEGEM